MTHDLVHNPSEGVVLKIHEYVGGVPSHVASEVWDVACIFQRT